MRKQKSIRWFRYTVEDAKAAQAELDEQAERGWELEEVGLFTATFRRAERPRRCWVEPARWKSERKKDWDARSDYLTLCGEAGWELLEEDGWLTGSGGDYLKLELEDEKVNPKYGILTVKGYLQKARFAPDTTIELAGTPVGIYE